MTSNTSLNAATVVGGDVIRTIDKSGIKTQVVTLDLGGSGAESLPSGALPVTGPLTNTELRAANVNIAFDDISQLDSFSRLRVSQPEFAFDAQFTYDLQPLLYEPLTDNGGAGTATVAHDATNRCALMTFTGVGASAKSYLQSYEYIPYQPGRSQLVFVTFNMKETAANVTKFAGYSDGTNGIEFQLSGSTKQFVIYSSSGTGTQTATQANWNVDKLDGTGRSGLTLDITKTQILVISFQALYVGRVVLGFDIGGQIIIAHQFANANAQTLPYIATANLPIRCGMTSSGVATTTMRYICCSVMREGGNQEALGYQFVQDTSITAASGVRTHALSIEPKLTFNGFTNRTKLVLDTLDILVTGSNPVYWELMIGQPINGTTTMLDVNASYSATQYNILGTLNGAETIEMSAGFVGASNQTKGATSISLKGRYPFTLDAAGDARLNGRVSLVITGLGGTSACKASLSWREIR